MKLSAILEEDAALVEGRLGELLSASRFAQRNSSGLELMLEAMSYSLMNGGKRIRPLLALEFCEMLCGDKTKALQSACALEMIHTYSLIHDDLPCMDNDDMRRGKPSSHVKFGYEYALLAGDALLTLAFETVTGCTELDSARKCEIVRVLSEKAGASGMVAGQVMDLKNESRRASLDEIRATDSLKTGELIRAAVLIGCIAAGKSQDDKIVEDALAYASDLGLAFQVVDDILDVTSNSAVLGKPVGSDEKNAKSTYVSLLGLEKARKFASELTASAKDAISDYERNEFLLQFADYLCSRIY